MGGEGGSPSHTVAPAEKKTNPGPENVQFLIAPPVEGVEVEAREHRTTKNRRYGTPGAAPEHPLHPNVPGPVSPPSPPPPFSIISPPFPSFTPPFPPCFPVSPRFCLFRPVPPPPVSPVFPVVYDGLGGMPDLGTSRPCSYMCFRVGARTAVGDPKRAVGCPPRPWAVSPS